MLVKLFHATVPVLFLYTIWYDQMYVDLPFPTKELEDLPLKARPIFLTVWCFVFQILYFTISLLNDFTGTDEPNPKRPPFIRALKDHAFSIAFPLAVFVSSFFWGVCFVNKELIVPKEIERVFPQWINHMMHTMIAVFILIEIFVTNKNYPSRRFGIKAIIGLSMSYYVLIHIVYFQTGVWVYPYLALFSHFTRSIYLVSSIIVSFGIYILGEKFNSLLSPKLVVYSNGKAVSNVDSKKKLY